jgi:hypothetical protein
MHFQVVLKFKKIKRKNMGTLNLKIASTPGRAPRRNTPRRHAAHRRPGPPTHRAVARPRPAPSFSSPCPEQPGDVLPHVPAPASAPAGPPVVPVAVDGLCTSAAARSTLIPPPLHRGTTHTPPAHIGRL